MRCLLSLILAVTLITPVWAGEDIASPDNPPFAVSKWEVTRVRKGATGASNVVTIAFNMKNLTGVNLDHVDCVIELRETMGGKVGDLKPAPVRYLKPDEEKPVTITAEFVPSFGAYFVRFKYLMDKKDMEAQYLGTSPFDGPVFTPAKPQGRSIRLFVMGYDLLRDPKTGVGKLDVMLKNFGGLPARYPWVRLRLYSNDRKLIGKVEGALSSPKLPKDGVEVIGPGEEKTYSVMMSGIPNYDMFDVFVTHEAPRPEECLPGDKFNGGKEVEIIVKTAKVAGRQLNITGRARNGLDKAIQNITMDFSLLLHFNKTDSSGREMLEKETIQVGTAKVNTGVSLAAGEEKDFTFNMPVPGRRFDDYAYTLGYDEGGEETAQGGAKPEEVQKKTGEISFEVTGGERLKPSGVRLDGYVIQKGGSETEVPVYFVFTDADDKEVARRELKVTVPADSKKFFNVKYEDLPEFKGYKLEMGELAPAKAEEQKKDAAEAPKKADETPKKAENAPK
jgi:hypothetical protein